MKTPVQLPAALSQYEDVLPPLGGHYSGTLSRLTAAESLSPWEIDGEVWRDWQVEQRAARAGETAESDCGSLEARLAAWAAS